MAGSSPNWSDRCVSRIEGCYQQKDQINDRIIETLKSCLASLSRINESDKEIALLTKMRLQAELEKARETLIKVYEEVDDAQEKLNKATEEITYMKQALWSLKKKYPEEDIDWAMKDNEDKA